MTGKGRAEVVGWRCTSQVAEGAASWESRFLRGCDWLLGGDYIRRSWFLERVCSALGEQLGMMNGENDIGEDRIDFSVHINVVDISKSYLLVGQWCTARGSVAVALLRYRPRDSAAKNKAAPNEICWWNSSSSGRCSPQTYTVSLLLFLFSFPFFLLSFFRCAARNCTFLFRLHLRATCSSAASLAVFIPPLP